MTARVVIVGAGYGGMTVARALQGQADVTVIDPRDAFVNIAGAPRAIARPDWAENIFFPLSKVVDGGSHVQGRVVAVDSRGVDLASGERIDADYIVLATGSTYPYPVNPASDSTATALADFRHAHENLAAAQHVLILGGGPVGLELAGETREVWPDKMITIVESRDQLLPGFLPEVRRALHEQLADLRIDVLTGTRLVSLPSIAAGVPGDVSVTSTEGSTIEADIWLQAFGSTLNTTYLAKSGLVELTSRGEVPVNPDLTVGNHRHIYALGDITDIAEAKMAGHARLHAEAVAQNIRDQIGGTEQPTATYLPSGTPTMLIPLGSSRGVGQLPSEGGPALAPQEVIAEFKGRDLFTARFKEQFGIENAATEAAQ